MSLVQFDSWHFCSSSLDYLFICFSIISVKSVQWAVRSSCADTPTHLVCLLQDTIHLAVQGDLKKKKRWNETPARITEEWMKSALQELLSNSSWLSDIAGGSFLMGCLQRKQFADHKFGESRRDSMMTGKKTKWAFPRVKLFSLSRWHVTELWKFEASRQLEPGISNISCILCSH